MNPDTSSLTLEAADPATGQERLAELAYAHPELHDTIAANPNSYAGLNEWIAAYPRPASLPNDEPEPNAFREPNRSTPLAWGTYELRYGLGLALLVFAGFGPISLIVPVPIVPSILAVLLATAGVVVFPTSAARRLIAGGVLAVATVSVVVTLVVFASDEWALYNNYSIMAALLPIRLWCCLAIWLVLRARPGLAFVLMPAILVLSLTQSSRSTAWWSTFGSMEWLYPIGYFVPVTLVDGLAIAGLAWAARGIAIARSRRSPSRADRVEQRPDASTNILSIFALIFGIGGGALGIILGHVARSQIRRTGEAGWGLATAGLVLGYIGVGVSVLVVIVAVSLAVFSRPLFY